MSEPLTLFLIAKHGLYKGPKQGLLESWMWNLNSNDETMAYVSLHKSKTDRAYKGGLIVAFRDATPNDIAQHQKFLKSIGQEQMQATDARRIIVFQLGPMWNKGWLKEAITHQMAYKANGI